MSVFRTADIDADIRRWDQAQQEWEDSLPKCERCKEPQDAHIFEIDGERLCLGCVEEKYRRSVV